MYPKSAKLTAEPEASVGEMRAYIASKGGNLSYSASSSSPVANNHDQQRRPATATAVGATSSLTPLRSGGMRGGIAASPFGLKPAASAAATFDPHHSGGIKTTAPLSGMASPTAAAAASAAPLSDILPSAQAAHRQWQDRIARYRPSAGLLDKVSRQTGDDMPFAPWMAATLDALAAQLKVVEGPAVLAPNAVPVDFREERSGGAAAGGREATAENVAAVGRFVPRQKPQHLFTASTATDAERWARNVVDGSGRDDTTDAADGVGALFGGSGSPSRSLLRSTQRRGGASPSIGVRGGSAAVAALVASPIADDEGADVVQRPHPLRSAVAVTVLQRLFVSFKLPTSLWRDVLALIFDSNCANDILSRDFSGANSVSGYLERRFLCDTVRRLEAERTDLANLNKTAVGHLHRLHDVATVERRVGDGARLRMAFAAWRSLKYLNAWRAIALRIRLERGGSLWVRRCFDAWKTYVTIEQLHAEVSEEKEKARAIVASAEEVIEDGQNALRRQLLSERKEHEAAIEDIKSKKIMSEETVREVAQLREVVAVYRQDQRSYERRIADLEAIVKEQSQAAQLAGETARRCLHGLRRTALLMVGTRIMNGIKASDVIVNARGIGTSSQFRFSSNDGVDTITAASLPSPALSAGLIQLTMQSQKRLATGGSASASKVRRSGSGGGKNSKSASLSSISTAAAGNSSTAPPSSSAPSLRFGLAALPPVSSSSGNGPATLFPNASPAVTNPLELSALSSATTAISSGVHLASVLCSFVNGVIQKDREEQRREEALSSTAATARGGGGSVVGGAGVVTGAGGSSDGSPFASLMNTARGNSSSSFASPLASPNGAARRRAVLLFPGITNIPVAFADGHYYVHLIRIIFGAASPLHRQLEAILNGCTEGGGTDGGSGFSGGMAAPQRSGSTVSHHSAASGPFTVSPSFARSSVFLDGATDTAAPTRRGTLSVAGVGGDDTPLQQQQQCSPRAAFVTEQLFALILLRFDEAVRHYAQQTAKIRQREVVRELLGGGGGGSGNDSNGNSYRDGASFSRRNGGGGGERERGRRRSPSPGEPLSQEEEALLNANEAAFGDVGADVPLPGERGFAVDLLNDTLQGHNNFGMSDVGGGGGPPVRLGELHARLLETPFVVQDFTNADRPFHVAAHFYLVSCLLKVYASTKMIPLPQWSTDLFSAETPPHSIPIDVLGIPAMARAHPGPPRDDKIRKLQEQMLTMMTKNSAFIGGGGGGGGGDSTPASNVGLSTPTADGSSSLPFGEAPASGPSLESMVGDANRRTVLDATTQADALSTSIVLAQASVNAWSVLAQYVQEAYFFAFKSVFILAGGPSASIGGSATGEQLKKARGGGKRFATAMSARSKVKQNRIHGSSDDDDDEGGAVSPTASLQSLGAKRATSAQRTAIVSVLDERRRSTDASRLLRRLQRRYGTGTGSRPSSGARLWHSDPSSAEGFGPFGSLTAVDNNGNGLLSSYPVGVGGATPSHPNQQQQHCFGHTAAYVSLVRGASLAWVGDQRRREAVEVAVITSTMAPACRRFVFIPSTVHSHVLALKAAAAAAGQASTVGIGCGEGPMGSGVGGGVSVAPLVGAMMASDGHSPRPLLPSSSDAVDGIGGGGGGRQRSGSLSLSGRAAASLSATAPSIKPPTTIDDYALRTLVEALYELTPSVFIANSASSSSPQPLVAQLASMERFVCYDLPLSAPALDAVFSYAMGLVAAPTATPIGGGGVGASGGGGGSSIYNSIMNGGGGASSTASPSTPTTHHPLTVSHSAIAVASQAADAVLPHRQWQLLLSDLRYFGLLGADDGSFFSAGPAANASTPQQQQQQRGSGGIVAEARMASEAAAMRQTLDGYSRRFAAHSPKEGLLPREFAMALAYIATRHFGPLIGDDSASNNSSSMKRVTAGEGWVASMAQRMGGGGALSQQQQQRRKVSSPPISVSVGAESEQSDGGLVRRQSSSAFVSRSRSRHFSEDNDVSSSDGGRTGGSSSEELSGSEISGDSISDGIRKRKGPAKGAAAASVRTAPTQHRVPRPSELSLFMLLQTCVLPRLGQSTPAMFVPAADARLQLRALRNAPMSSPHLLAGSSIATPNWAWASVGLGAALPAAPLSVAEMHTVFSLFRDDLRSLWSRCSADAVAFVIAFAKANGASLAAAASAASTSSGAILGSGAGVGSSRRPLPSSAALKSGGSGGSSPSAGNTSPTSTYDLSRARQGSVMGGGGGGSDPSSRVDFYNASNSLATAIDEAMAPFALWAYNARHTASAREKEAQRRSNAAALQQQQEGQKGDDSPAAQSVSPVSPTLTFAQDAKLQGGSGKASGKKDSSKGGIEGGGGSPSAAVLGAASASIGLSSSSNSSSAANRPYGRNEAWLAAVMSSKAAAASAAGAGGGGGGTSSDRKGGGKSGGRSDSPQSASSPPPATRKGTMSPSLVTNGGAAGGTASTAAAKDPTGLLGTALIPPAGVLGTAPMGCYSGVGHAVAAFLAFVRRAAAQCEGGSGDITTAPTAASGGGKGGRSSSQHAAVKRSSSGAGSGGSGANAFSAAGVGVLSATHGHVPSAATPHVAATLRRPDVLRNIVASVAASVVSRDVPLPPEVTGEGGAASTATNVNDSTSVSGIGSFSASTSARAQWATMGASASVDPLTGGLGPSSPLPSSSPSAAQQRSNAAAEDAELLFRLRQEACQFEAFADMCALLATALWPPPLYSDAARLRLFVHCFATGGGL